MSEKTNYKIHMNLSQGVVEAEGDKSFVEAIYKEFKDKIGKIIVDAPKDNTQQSTSSQRQGAGGNKPAIGRFENLAQIFETAGQPSKGPKKILVVAYWQKIKGEESFSAKDIDGDLEKLGQPVSNSAGRLLELRNRHLVRKADKNGKSNIYCLTDKGVKEAEKMINREAEKE